ncbi:MAG: hypothetical protein AB7G06_09850 [Bdellovibrionales bacterium]
MTDDVAQKVHANTTVEEGVADTVTAFPSHLARPPRHTLPSETYAPEQLLHDTRPVISDDGFEDPDAFVPTLSQDWGAFGFRKPPGDNLG